MVHKPPLEIVVDNMLDLAFSISPLTCWILGIFGLVYLIHVVHWLLVAIVDPSPSYYTLYLRKLKHSGADMLQGNETDNIFLEEYNLLTDLMVPKLDYCIMKALKEDIPILSRQEQLHAVMHNQAKTQRRKNLKFDSTRWDWFIGIVHFCLLSAGTEIGYSLAGFAEATTLVTFYWPMAVIPCSRGFMSDEYVYHALEELEHGPLTTQFLRTKLCWTLSPLMWFPFISVVYVIYLLLPPVMLLMTKPCLLWQYDKTYKDFVVYYCAMIPTFLVTIGACVMYWVLPFRPSHETHQHRYQFFVQKVRERGIEFDVLDQQTFRIEGNQVIKVDA